MMWINDKHHSLFKNSFVETENGAQWTFKWTAMYIENRRSKSFLFTENFPSFFFFWLPSILFVSWDKIVYISFWLERPKIATFTFGDAPLKFGESASVQCTISGGDLPMTVQWMLNGIEIPPHLEATTAKIGKRIHVLSIESVKADHRGNYSCVATKSSWNGCVYSTAYCYRFVLWLNHSLPFSQCFWNFACCLLFIFSLESVRMIRNLCQLEMENVSIQWFLKL